MNKFELYNIGRMRISFGVKQKKHIFVAHTDFLDFFVSLYSRIEPKLAIFLYNVLNVPFAYDYERNENDCKKNVCRVILFSIGPIKWKARHKNEQQKERKASIINFTFSLRIVSNTAKSNIL